MHNRNLVCIRVELKNVQKQTRNDRCQTLQNAVYILRVSNDLENLENLEKSGNFIEFKKNQGKVREFRDSSWKNHNLTFIGLILSGLMEFPASLLKKFLT